MNSAITGLLVGLGIGLALLAGDYMVLRRTAAERAKKQHKTVVEFDATEYSRIKSLAVFCVVLPPVLALAFWMVG